MGQEILAKMAGALCALDVHRAVVRQPALSFAVEDRQSGDMVLRGEPGAGGLVRVRPPVGSGALAGAPFSPRTRTVALPSGGARGGQRRFFRAVDGAARRSRTVAEPEEPGPNFLLRGVQPGAGSPVCLQFAHLLG